MATTSSPTRMTPAALRVLEVASDLFYTRGITTVGMELVAEEAGVTKKTIYDRFGSKQALVVAYLHARDQRWRQWLDQRLSDAGPPAHRILATFDALGEWMRASYPRGCAMVNAYAELSEPRHPGRAVAEEQKAWMRGLYADLATQHGAAEPHVLADTLLMLHEGAVVAFTVAGLEHATDTARATARTLLSAE